MSEEDKKEFISLHQFLEEATEDGGMVAISYRTFNGISDDIVAFDPSKKKEN